MTTAEETLTDFMITQNKQDLGEEIVIEDNADNNDLPIAQRAKYYDTEINNKDNEKAALAAKQALSLLMMVPMLLGGIGVFAYILITIFPSIFNFIKSFFFMML